MAFERQLAWYLEVLPLEGERIVDLGANEGVVSEFFATVNHGANRVVSVEPLEENVSLINARIARLGAQERWTVLPCAASSSDGRATLALGGGDVVERNSVLLGPHDARSGVLREVETKTLASICPDATVVKIDIEGHEYEVIEQALGAMKSVKAWAIELHERGSRPLAPFFSALRRAGYRLFGAGVSARDPKGPWGTVEIPHEFQWSMVAPAKSSDGRSVKVIHVVALGGGAH